MADNDPARPSLDEVLLQAVRGQLAQVHVGFAARVVSYDSVKQTVCIQPIVRGRRRLEDGTSEVYRLPQLSGVPVEWPQGSGGTYSLTFPLHPGDVGTVRVFERSHDEWKATGNADCSPQHPRRFDLSDCTFFPGGSSPADPLAATALDGAAMVLGFPALKMGSNAAVQPFVFGLAMALLFNAHTHATPAGPSGPPLEGALLAPMNNAASPTYPHCSTKIKGE